MPIPLDEYVTINVTIPNHVTLESCRSMAEIIAREALGKTLDEALDMIRRGEQPADPDELFGLMRVETWVARWLLAERDERERRLSLQVEVRPTRNVPPNHNGELSELADRDIEHDPDS